MATPSFERYRFTYEDGSHNAESLMVAPDGALYIVTKLAPGSGGAVNATGPSSVYKLDPSSLSTGQVARAVKLTTLSIPKSGEAALSAAAAHPCGAGFLVRTYDRVYEFLVPAGSNDFERAFTATPTVIAMPDEPQSEGIDYQSDGRGFISSGEGAEGRKARSSVSSSDSFIIRMADVAAQPFQGLAQELRPGGGERAIV